MEEGFKKGEMKGFDAHKPLDHLFFFIASSTVIFIFFTNIV